MRERITQRDIKEYKKITAQVWHDQKWWDYMKTSKAEAIGYAIDTKEPYDTLADLQKKAIDYSAANGIFNK